MVDTREGTIHTGQSSALGQRTVGFQDPVGNRGLVMDHETHDAYATALLDQLEDLGANVKEYHRRLRLRQYSAISLLILNLSTIVFWNHTSLQNFLLTTPIRLHT